MRWGKNNRRKRKRLKTLDEEKSLGRENCEPEEKWRRKTKRKRVKKQSILGIGRQQSVECIRDFEKVDRE